MAEPLPARWRRRSSSYAAPWPTIGPMERWFGCQATFQAAWRRPRTDSSSTSGPSTRSCTNTCRTSVTPGRGHGMSRTIRKGGLFLLVALALVAGCARSPEAKKARYLERGDRYFRQAQHREAIPEYRNVLRIEGTDPHASRQLGLAYYQTGELSQAFRYLLKAQELEPDNLDVRLKLGTIYLLGGRSEEAASEAEVTLRKEPTNLPALTLLAGAAKTPQDVDTALRRLEAVRADVESQAKFHLALAGLY